jgi:hypothetical protein
MKTNFQNSRRQWVQGVCAMGLVPLLSSCGSLIYPDRIQQKERGKMDPAVVILDGLGLFFFILPGIIAFAVDFSTEAIYYPADNGLNEPEETIFDVWKNKATTSSSFDQPTIERFLGERVGRPVSLDREEVWVEELSHINQLPELYRQSGA